MPASDCTMRGKARTMQDAFYALFAMNGSPRNAALFVSRDDRFENYHFYFSPGAAEIARALIEGYSAEPCSTPVREEYRPVVAGHCNEIVMITRSERIIKKQNGPNRQIWKPLKRGVE
jgi:hypothetical protein